MRLVLNIILLFLATYSLHAEEVINNTQQVFVEALTKAIKAHDKEAFYSLFCLDGVEDGQKEIKSMIDFNLSLAKADRKFKTVISPPDPNVIGTVEGMETNLKIVSICTIYWEDLPREGGEQRTKSNQKTFFILGERNGKTLISTYIKKKANQYVQVLNQG